MQGFSADPTDDPIDSGTSRPRIATAMVVCIQFYARWGCLVRRSLHSARKSLDSEPMSDEELRWMRDVGDHVHRNSLWNWNPFRQRQQ